MHVCEEKGFHHIARRLRRISIGDKDFVHERLIRAGARHEDKTFSGMVVWFGGPNGATSSLVVTEAPLIRKKKVH